MKLLSAFILGCMFLGTSSLAAEQSPCACKDCRCTSESHCGCFSSQGCSCEDNTGNSNSNGCPCRKRQPAQANLHHGNEGEHQTKFLPCKKNRHVAAFHHGNESEHNDV